MTRDAARNEATRRASVLGKAYAIIWNPRTGDHMFKALPLERELPARLVLVETIEPEGN